MKQFNESPVEAADRARRGLSVIVTDAYVKVGVREAPPQILSVDNASGVIYRSYSYDRKGATEDTSRHGADAIAIRREGQDGGKLNRKNGKKRDGYRAADRVTDRVRRK